jgi:hypothetical protein
MLHKRISSFVLSPMSILREVEFSEALWALQTHQGCGFRPHLDDDETRVPGTTLLDPIDPTLVAFVDIFRIRHRAGWVQGIRRACDILLNEQDFNEFVLKQPLSRVRPTLVSTANEYAEHLDILSECKVVKPVRSEHSPKAYASYFAVRKERFPIETARAIFNCRQFNDMCKDPPKFKLVTAKSLAKRLGSMRTMGDARAPRARLMVGDLRHWYYQIPIDKWISTYCRIHLGDKDYEPRAMPMGWSWANWLGQMLSWGLVIAALDQRMWIIDFGVSADYGTEIPMPGVIEKNNSTITIAVYIDGFIFVDTAPTIQFGEDLTFSFVDEVGQARARWKFAPKDASVGEFVGVDWLCRRGQILMRMPREAVAGWKKKGVKLADKANMSIREISSLTGIAWYVFETMGFAIPDTLYASAVRISKLAHQLGWDATVPQQYSAWLKSLLTTYDQWLSQATEPLIRWDPTHLVHGTGVTTVISDADPKSWAFGFTMKDGDTIRSEAGNFPDSVNDLHIWQKELDAALAGLTSVLPHMHPNMHLVLLTDNTVVVGIFKSKRTLIESKLRSVAQFFEQVASMKVTFAAHWIPSEKNPADDLTRGNINATISADRWLEALIFVGPIRRLPEARPSYFARECELLLDWSKEEYDEMSRDGDIELFVMPHREANLPPGIETSSDEDEHPSARRRAELRSKRGRNEDQPDAGK